MTMTTTTANFSIYVSPHDRRALEAVARAYVHDAYRYRQPGQPEPSISATDILDYLLQHTLCPLTLKHATRKRQQTWVRSLLTTAVRGGRLEASLGASTRRAGEVRLFAPISA
jgi:hypothetical protein